MECFWCMSGYKANAKVLVEFCSPEMDDDLTRKMQLNLTGCLDCVMAYHYARQYFLKRNASSRKELFTWETRRLCVHIKKSLHSDTSNSEEKVKMSFGDELSEMLSISLHEILIFPYLLWSKELASLATEALLRLEALGSPLPFYSKLPGLYILVIHPNSEVRKLAQSTVNFLGSISCDDFDDLSDVMKWIINVSEFGLLGSEDWEIANDGILPSHLFQKTKKEYWASVCTLLEKFEARTIRYQLLSRDHHDQFINIILNAMDQENCPNSGRDSEFWPLLNCLLILLKRLESGIWQHVNLTHTDLFLLVVLHPAYRNELQQLPGYKMKDLEASDEHTALSGGPAHDNNDHQSQRVTDPEESFQVLMLTWLKRFLESVVVFGDDAEKAVKVVFKYFDCLKDELEIPSEGYDNTMVTMISCLEFLLKNSLKSFLNISAKRWIPDVLEILSLDLDQLSAGQEQAISFCKLFLQSVDEIPKNVSRDLIAWLEGKNEIDEDYELRNLVKLENLLLSHFKDLPPVTRTFVRERRTIMMPKTTNVRSANSIKSETKSVSVTMAPQNTARKSHSAAVTSRLMDGEVRLKKLDMEKTSVRTKQEPIHLLSNNAKDDESVKRLKENSDDKGVPMNQDVIVILDTSNDSSSDDDEPIGKKFSKKKLVKGDIPTTSIKKKSPLDTSDTKMDVQNSVETIWITSDSSSDEEPSVCSRKRFGDEANLPTVFKRKCVEEKMDQPDFIEHEELGLEEQQQGCEETAVKNSFCVEDVHAESKGNFAKTDTLIFNISDTDMDTTNAAVIVESKVDLLESHHQEELVAREQKDDAEKVTNSLKVESSTSNLEPSLEAMDATKETKMNSWESQEPEILVTSVLKRNEDGKMTNSSLPSSAAVSSNTKSVEVTTARNAAAAVRQTKVPPNKPVNAPVGNKVIPIRKKALETKPSKLLTVEELYYVILNWDPFMLMKQYNLEIANCGKVKPTFESTDDYYSVFKPLLFLECWAQALREWQQARNHKEDIIVVKSVNDFVDRFLLVVCHQHVITTNKADDKFFRENDLVMLKLKDENRKPLFAIVQSARPLCNSGPPRGGNPPKSGVEDFDVSITLRLIPKERPLIVNEKIRCVFVTSLITTLRQWNGLMFFPRSLLARDILQPRINHCFNSSLRTEKTDAAEQVYNKSQAAAINGTVAALRLPYPIPRISFIQGPPGTGKSHTIIGLLKSYLENQEKDIRAEKANRLPGSKNLVRVETSGKILLCAPSNAAVYVLVRRMIAEIKSTTTNNLTGRKKNCGDIHLVCVGRASVHHPELAPFALETLTKIEVSKRSSNNHENERIAHGKVDSLREKIESLGKHVYQLRLAGFQHDSYEIKSLNYEIEGIVKEKQMLEKKYLTIRRKRQMLKDEEQKIRKDILKSADVICCTLSASGSPLLHKLKTSIAHVPFGCVIVDEACQSCELDLLIPLQFGSSKLVMVGDPEQLRSTVISKKAQELMLGQSMYERLYRVFKKRAHDSGRSLHATNDNPIQLLDLQYRMHPAISFFPAKYVYQGRVQDERSLATRKCVSSIKPYALLNVRNGIEQNSPCGSLCNPVESGLVVEICSMLQREVSENHFGIITPYRAQVNLIRNRLAQSGLKNVEVDTVDGFQGREKDFVIMSCVRAGKDPHRGIGFLADRTRLNVALTRAKYSLIILLNVNSLETNTDWRACIDDARKRGVLFDVISTKDLSRVFEKSQAVETDRIPKSKASNSTLHLTSAKDSLISKTSISNSNAFTGCINQNARSSILRNTTTSATNAVLFSRVSANFTKTSTSNTSSPDVPLQRKGETNGHNSSSDEFDFDDHEPGICNKLTAGEMDSDEKRGEKAKCARKIIKRGANIKA
ncbi:probable helicase senataxin isoform X2 [Dendronephthya gigantea]|uniref:probable helicase senataxin isoform X2 n=1 Tax=Dendronephthya gigantea TaxID=151771 RepID=UPI00106BB007|nr:probable helicase senataxin isoform X2 [Dendronephthya gigantea]